MFLQSVFIVAIRYRFFRARPRRNFDPLAGRSYLVKCSLQFV